MSVRPILSHHSSEAPQFTGVTEIPDARERTIIVAPSACRWNLHRPDQFKSNRVHHHGAGEDVHPYACMIGIGVCLSTSSIANKMLKRASVCWDDVVCVLEMICQNVRFFKEFWSAKKKKPNPLLFTNPAPHLSYLRVSAKPNLPTKIKTSPPFLMDLLNCVVWMEGTSAFCAALAYLIARS